MEKGKREERTGMDGKTKGREEGGGEGKVDKSNQNKLGGGSSCL